MKDTAHWVELALPVSEDQRLGAFMLAQVAAIGDDEQGEFAEPRWYLADLLGAMLAERFEANFGVNLEEFFADLKKRTAKGEPPARIISAAIAEAAAISRKELLDLAPHLQRRMRRCAVAPVAAVSSPLTVAAGARPRLGGGR